MILNEIEVTERMNSPLNLLNKLKSITTNGHKHTHGIVSIPTADKIIEDLDEKLSINSIKNKASNIMIQAMDELRMRVNETTKPEQLAKIAAEMNKIVTSENENRRGDDNRPQFHLYAPQFSSENHYETIYARE